LYFNKYDSVIKINWQGKNKKSITRFSKPIKRGTWFGKLSFNLKKLKYTEYKSGNSAVKPKKINVGSKNSHTAIKSFLAFIVSPEQ